MSSVMALDSLQSCLHVIEKPHQMITDSKSHSTTEYLVGGERKSERVHHTSSIITVQLYYNIRSTV